MNTKLAVASAPALFLMLVIGPMPTATAVPVTTPGGCTFYPALEDPCSYSCELGDYVFVQVSGLYGGGITSCGGVGAQCIVSDGNGFECIAYSPKIDEDNWEGTCAATGELRAAANNLLTVTCGTSAFTP